MVVTAEIRIFRIGNSNDFVKNHILMLLPKRIRRTCKHLVRDIPALDQQPNPAQVGLHLRIIGIRIGNAVSPVGIRIHQLGGRHLLQIAGAVGLFGRCPGAVQRGQQHRGQNRDDRNDDQQFDQREAGGEMSGSFKHVAILSSSIIQSVVLR